MLLRSSGARCGGVKRLRLQGNSLNGCTCALKSRYKADTRVVGKCDETSGRRWEMITAHLLCSIACLSRSAAIFGFRA